MLVQISSSLSVRIQSCAYKRCACVCRFIWLWLALLESTHLSLKCISMKSAISHGLKKILVAAVLPKNQHVFKRSSLLTSSTKWKRSEPHISLSTHWSTNWPLLTGCGSHHPLSGPTNKKLMTSENVILEPPYCTGTVCKGAGYFLFIEKSSRLFYFISVTSIYRYAICY